jgi:hypothetical protein
MARIVRGKLSSDQRGISDILAIAFMFLLVIFAGILLNGYRFGTINSAADRQLQLKVEYMYRTLELSQVENYSLSYFTAIAENLIMVTPQVVPGNYLRQRIDDAFSYLSPPGYATILELRYENSSWVQSNPKGAITLDNASERFTFSGKITMILAEAGGIRVAQLDASVALFKY